MSVQKKTTEEILDSLGMDIASVKEAGATIEAWAELHDRERPITTTATLPNGTHIHHHQMVRERLEIPFGDDETTEWVITSIDEDEEEIVMKIPEGSWDKTVVSFEEFVDDGYEPLTIQKDITAAEAEVGVEPEDDTPMFGY